MIIYLDEDGVKQLATLINSDLNAVKEDLQSQISSLGSSSKLSALFSSSMSGKVTEPDILYFLCGVDKDKLISSTIPLTNDTSLVNANDTYIKFTISDNISIISDASTMCTISSIDITDGESPLKSGHLYLVYDDSEVADV